MKRKKRKKWKEIKRKKMKMKKRTKKKSSNVCAEIVCHIEVQREVLLVKNHKCIVLVNIYKNKTKK